MTMPWFWKFWKRPGCPDHLSEARAHLARIRSQQAEVDRITQLTEGDRPDHFREAVQHAWEAALRGGTP